MNAKQAQLILDKINALYKNMSMDSNTVSAIERDLMLSYIKQLYEVFIELAPGDSLPRNNPGGSGMPQPPPPQPSRTYRPPRIIEIPDSLKQSGQQPPMPSPPPMPQPVPEPVPEPVPSPRPQPSPEPEPRPEPPRPDVPSVPQGQPEPYHHQPATISVSREITALFEHRNATELSERLSERSVNDLTKALAINDRLLYMNELFGKDLNRLNDTLSELNRFNSMEQAKSVLFPLAEQFNWLEEDRKEVAKDFLKLVRRRYV